MNIKNKRVLWPTYESDAECTCISVYTHILIQSLNSRSIPWTLNIIFYYYIFINHIHTSLLKLLEMQILPRNLNCTP